MLKVVSINIERDLHHDSVTSFLLKEQPDLVCMQEVFKEDLDMYKNRLEMDCVFSPMCFFRRKDREGFGIMGVAIFAKNILSNKNFYIVGSEGEIPKHIHQASSTQRNIINLPLLCVSVKNSLSEIFSVSTFHFTWTPEGVSTEYQKQDVADLIKVLDTQVKDFVLMGDSNCPRGLESFDMFAQKYKDNIPAEYDSSVDEDLHRVKGLKQMVDVCFSTVEYKVENVRLVSGVSDHKAVVAELYQTHSNPDSHTR